jgi:hypothetical protein
VKVPVLIRTTFHPDWARSDGERIYPVSPFFMLTFANSGFEAEFHRTKLEQAALSISAFVFLVLISVLIGLRTTTFSSLLHKQPEDRKQMHAEPAETLQASLKCSRAQRNLYD